MAAQLGDTMTKEKHLVLINRKVGEERKSHIIVYDYN